MLGRNQLLRILQGQGKAIPGLDAVLQTIDHTTTELQEKIMQTRMQPVANVFNKFPRIIRELSRKIGKEVSLLVEGAEVELDKSIVEALSDPLTHLLRNAVDHGIEYPGDRERAGKNRQGLIRLKAYHESGYVNIDVLDDGAGMDTEKIRQKGVDKGLVTIAESQLYGEREILAMIFQAGFSTADKVTDVSGRGVGMDVVKTNIEKLGGTVEVQTQLGRGSTFHLTLPLTVAIIPSLIVAVAGHKFALPQVNLQEMIRINPRDGTRKIEVLHGRKVFRLRDKLLPLVNLAEVLDLPEDVSWRENIVRVLVLKNGSRRYGLVVDVIYDGEEILVKPLPRYLRTCEYYSGVTILGDGKIAMILDPEGIAVRAALRFAEETALGGELEQAAAMRTEQQSLLQFRCSGPEVFALDMSMISRVEEFALERIETIGEREYLQFRGKMLRLIRPEQYLPVAVAPRRRDKGYAIIPKLGNFTVAIVADSIFDTLQADVRFNAEEIRAKGLLGTAILNGHITLLLDLFGLLELADPELAVLNAGQRREIGGATVLVVEDTPFFSRIMTRHLEWAGYRVIAAPEGNSALQILREQPVDLILTDIIMPVLDGLELLKAVRRERRWPGCR